MIDKKTIDLLEAAYCSIEIQPKDPSDKFMANMVRDSIIDQWKEIFKLARIGLWTKSNDFILCYALECVVNSPRNPDKDIKEICKQVLKDMDTLHK